jgi:23S rRNA (guanine745-N1)-methyltransferase
VHERTLGLSQREVSTLVEMGPSAWHTDPATLAARIATLPEPVPVTASVRLSRYHKDLRAAARDVDTRTT